MGGRDLTSWRRTLAATAALGALVVTVGCGGTRDLSTFASNQPAQTLNGAQSGVPVVVSCEPNQRTIVRPSIVNGQAVSQVECIAADPSLAAFAPAVQQQPAAMPVAYRQVSAAQPVYRGLSDTQVVPVQQTTSAVRPARQVVYQDREPVRKTRSVAKSAIIIGSSAGAGAGVGAAVGGKKGALIGAAIGGGGATIWDQVTRRR